MRTSVADLITLPFQFPADIIATLQQEQEVWEHYCAFSEPYKRIRVAYIDAARKRPAEFKRRLDNFISKTRQNRLIVGYGGIEKYYSTTHNTPDK